MIKIIIIFNYYKHDKDELMLKYVQERLSKSLTSYYQDLLVGFDSLLSYSDKTILKKVLKSEK